jgi:predicted helicase
MLDSKAIQTKLDTTQEQYSNGLITEFEKLSIMTGAVEEHIKAHKKLQSEWENHDMNSYDRACRILRNLERIQAFEDKLNLYVK